jgi:hypothetical protein
MTEENRFSLIKPTLDTPFHIDFNWWQQHDSDWRVFLIGLLCEEHQTAFANLGENVVIDFIDPETAEVKPADGLLHILLSHCAKQKDFISTSGSLVGTVFRVYLSNNNSPLSPNQLSELINRPAKTILVTLSSPNVYKGIRPIIQR